MILRRRIMADGDGIDYSKQYLTIEALEDGVTISWKYTGDQLYTSTNRGYVYFTDDLTGSWTKIGSSVSGINLKTLNTGEKIYLRSTASEMKITYNQFASNGKGFKLYGNTTSLLYGGSFNGQMEITDNGGVRDVFSGTDVVDAENLVFATTMSSSCYMQFFMNCASLIVPPKVLPSTTLSNNCYYSMFQGCTSLTEAPRLPATTLAQYCYYSMFQGCTSLTTAPELPATVMQDHCYRSMFQGCASLTEAPEILPATTLVQSCYQNMFRNCGSLERAPELPATTLVQSCYQNMFYNSPSLNYIKCLAVNKSASNCTSNWVSDVAEEGVFEKSSGVSWSTGSSGIPSGWTVVEV